MSPLPVRNAAASHYTSGVLSASWESRKLWRWLSISVAIAAAFLYFSFGFLHAHNINLGPSIVERTEAEVTRLHSQDQDDIPGDDWSAYWLFATDIRRHGLSMPAYKGPYLGPGG